MTVTAQNVNCRSQNTDSEVLMCALPALISCADSQNKKTEFLSLLLFWLTPPERRTQATHNDLLSSTHIKLREKNWISLVESAKKFAKSEEATDSLETILSRKASLLDFAPTKYLDE